MNRYGDNGHPCLIPVCCGSHSDALPSISTQNLVSLCSDLEILIICSSTKDIKSEINPAKWSYLMPDFVSSFTTKFSYTEERDTLIQKIVDTYIKSKHYSLKEVLEKREDIKIDLQEIVKDKKDEIINFLNQGENYGVGRSMINDILNEKKFANKTFAEKIIGQNSSMHSRSI